LAIERSMPVCAERWKFGVRCLAWRLKSLPHLSDADTVDLEEIVATWHQEAVRVVPGLSLFEAVEMFGGWWRGPRCQIGTRVIDRLFEQVRQGPLPDLDSGHQRRELLLLAALCQRLQRHAGPAGFFLSCRTAGELLGVTHQTAA